MNGTPDGSPEDINSDWADLDLRSTANLVGLWVDQSATAVSAVAAARPALEIAVDTIVERVRRGGRLVYVGAGTPGRLAWLDAVELPPTFGTDPALVQAVIAGADRAFQIAVEDQEDDPTTAPDQLAHLGLTSADTVVCLSASGRTPYVLAAAAYAARVGAMTIAVCNAAGSPLGAMADLSIEVLTGPEIVAGSTRLNAGTAQKIVLNMLSTLLMVRLGHTYGNLMVGVCADNSKLRVRTRHIVVAATGCTADDADVMLQRCHGDVKVAIVALLTSQDPESARVSLAAAGGSVRAATS